MDYKKILNVSLLLSIVGCLVGYILLHFSEKLFFCLADNGNICAFSLGKPLLFGFFQLGIIFLILRFLPEKVFKTWLCFASWYVPLAAILIFLTPALGSVAFPGKDGLIWTLGSIYLAVSIFLIGFRFILLKLHKARKR